MKPSAPGFEELYEVWMRIRNKMNVMEDQPRDFGAGIPLHLSEIHAIQAVGSIQDNNIRIIADFLGVTPSAASQVISKLTQRGLVKKVRGLKNEKEVSLELTRTGQIAFRNHELVHARMYEAIASRIGTLDEKERQMLDRVFSAIETVYDEKIRELSRDAGGKTERFL